jgi:hypothetical protein
LNRKNRYCRQCDSIFCLDDCPLSENPLAPRGFNVEGHELVVNGFCKTGSLKNRGGSAIAMIFCGRQPPLEVGAKHHRNALATTIVLFMLAAQVVSAVHFLLIPHTIDRHTGRVVHLRTSHEHQTSPEGTDHGSGDDRRPERSSSNEECPICLLLHQSKIPVTATSTAIPDAPPSAELIASLPETPADIHRRIYLVSPSHSPPPGALVFTSYKLV